MGDALSSDDLLLLKKQNKSDDDLWNLIKILNKKKWFFKTLFRKLPQV